MRSKFIFALAGLGVSMASASVAQATIFTFSYSIPTTDVADYPTGYTSASGYIDATGKGGGTFLATTISGSWNGEAITGLAPVLSEGANDNLLFPGSSPLLDNNGITFSVAGPIAGDQGNGVVNVFHYTGGYNEDSQHSTGSSDFMLTQAPTSMFDFSYSIPTNDAVDFPGGYTSASGVITAADVGNGTFVATAISGSWNGEAITGLAPVLSEGGNDNLLFPGSSPLIDNNGITFAVAGPIAGDQGNGVVNVFHYSGGYNEDSRNSIGSPDFTLTPVSAGAVPEPGSWAMMLVGMGLSGIYLRRYTGSGNRSRATTSD